MSAAPKFADGVLVRKRNPHHPDVRNPWLKITSRKDINSQDDFGRIGTIIKTERREEKSKRRPRQIFYCEVLWKGRDHRFTEWVVQSRLERV